MIIIHECVCEAECCFCYREETGEKREQEDEGKEEEEEAEEEYEEGKAEKEVEEEEEEPCNLEPLVPCFSINVDLFTGNNFKRKLFLRNLVVLVLPTAWRTALKTTIPTNLASFLNLRKNN